MDFKFISICEFVDWSCCSRHTWCLWELLQLKSMAIFCRAYLRISHFVNLLFWLVLLAEQLEPMLGPELLRYLPPEQLCPVGRWNAVCSSWCSEQSLVDLDGVGSFYLISCLNFCWRLSLCLFLFNFANELDFNLFSSSWSDSSFIPVSASELALGFDSRFLGTRSFHWARLLTRQPRWRSA